MARTITEIQNSMLNQLSAESALSLTSTSRVAVYRLLIYIVATAHWVVEKMQDQLKSDVTAIITAMKPHTNRWYGLKALAFRLGQNLVDEQDYYSDAGLTEQQISDAQIVKYAAVTDEERGLRLKVATSSGADLGPLDQIQQLPAFVAYMAAIKDAGVKLLITTANPDGLRLTLDIYYNPQVMNFTGGRLDGTISDPVGDAVRNFLKNLPFNGIFLLQSLVDVLQEVEGVVIADVRSAQAQYGNLPYTAFSVQYRPDAGYLRLNGPGDLTLNFLPYSE